MTQITHNDALPGSQVTAKLLAKQTSTNAALLGAALVGTATASAAGSWTIDLESNYTAEQTYGGSGSYWQITEPTVAGSTTVWNVIVPAGTTTGPLLVSGLSTAATLHTISVGETVNNVLGYNIPTDGVTDGSTQLVAALAAPGVTFFPPGVWVAQNIPVPPGAIIRGIGSGGYGFTVQSSCLRLAPGANNVPLLNFAQGDAHGRIDDIEIDGNAANQTASTTALLNWPDYTTGGGEEAQWDLFRVYVHDGFYDNIYMGNNRRAISSYKLVCKNAGRYGMNLLATDSRHVAAIIADCTSNGIDVSAGNHHFNNTDVFKCAIGVRVNSGVSHFAWIGCDTDLNNGQGMYLNMASGQDINIIGSFFRNNGQSSDASSYNIQIDGSGPGCNIIGGGGAALSSGITNRVINDIHVDTGALPPNIFGWTPSPSAARSSNVFSWAAQTFAATGTWDPQQKTITVTNSTTSYNLALPTVNNCNPNDTYFVIKTDSNTNPIVITGASQGSVSLAAVNAKASFRAVSGTWYQVG